MNPAVVRHRHQLVHLGPDGWAELLATMPAVHAPCLRHWAEHQWPLVVAQQRPSLGPESCAENTLRLGLPAPARWGRVKLGLEVPHAHIAPRLDPVAFPRMSALTATATTTSITASWSPDARQAWCTLAGQLSELGVSAQVYGSHGWQVITGLDYIHPRSDLDLLLPVTDLQQADAVADVLSNCPLHAPRLDGELMFPNGSATAWREWCLWRRGAATDLLVKSLNHVHLERDTRWLNRPNQLPCA